MTVLCLCPERGDWKLIPAYAYAFRSRGIRFHCVDSGLPFDCSLEQILRRCPERPSFIFQFESWFALLPDGLQYSDIPTVCFQIDTYAFTERRMRWSSLFDHVAVFHPGYEERFRQGGHPGAFLLPHAVRRDFFDQPELPREFEVGWVGETRGPLYQRREEWLPKLARSFVMNDWERRYSLQETAEVYRCSRLVVNIGRDDFPQDANLRVFEVLASGALLITALPSELTALGFEEGVHFAGYRHEAEIVDIARRFLGDEAARLRIAEAARSKVLQEHTYDSRVSQILLRLEEFGQRKMAPARNWRHSRVQLMYVDFFAASGLLDCAAKKLLRMGSRSFRDTLKGAALIGGAWIKGRRRNHAR
jgi:hypothetical protein